MNYICINKLKYDFDNKNNKYKKKIEELLSLINSYETFLEQKNNKNNIPNSIKKLKDEISQLNSQMDKTKNENYNLAEKNKEQEKIISNLKNEIDELTEKINALRTNPLANKNIQYLDKNENSTQTDKYQDNNEIISNSLQLLREERTINDDKKILEQNNIPLKVQPRERFTYFLKNRNSSMENITPIKPFNNNIINKNNTNNNAYELNSLSKITNFEPPLNSGITSPKDLNNNEQISFIEDFKKEINMNNFNEIAHRNISISKIFPLLASIIEQIKHVISKVKDKLNKINSDKKINPFHVLQVLDRIEKYISHIFIEVNQANGEFLSIIPTLSIIYNLISKYIYQKPFQIMTDIYEIKNNSLQKSEQIDDIKIDTSKNYSIKENIPHKIEDVEKFFEINKKIFSSSELIKYRNIYNNLSTSQIVKVFKDTCNNLKKAIYNLRSSYKSSMNDYTDFDDSICSKIKTKNGYLAECEDYKIVNEKILKLKKFEFNFKILMELLKNYLVCFEIFWKRLEREKQMQNKTNLIQLNEEINIIYNLLEDVIYYKLDELDDDTIFNRKLILKFLYNHKEYLAIIFDIGY